MGTFRQLLALSAKGNQQYYPDDLFIKTGIDENTLLMLHGDEYVDVGPYALPIQNSNTTIVTEGAKFKSAFYNSRSQSSSHYIATTLPKKLTRVFTLDFWFKPTSYSPTYGSFLSIGTNYTNGIFLQLIDGMNIIDIYICGKQKTANLRDNIPLNVWTHWALVGNGSNITLYINGKSLIVWDAMDINQDYLCLFKSSGLGRSVPGYFEEVRISDIARWNENFDPPTEPYGSAPQRPKPDVPADYRDMDYLHFTGSQYIDTNCALWQDPNWKMEFTISIDQHYNYNNLWGYMVETDTNNEAWVYSEATYYTRIGNASEKNYIGTLAAGTKYTIVHDNTGAQFISTINGDNSTSYARCGAGKTHSVCFGHRAGGQWFKGKLYGIKLWSNGELIRDMKPVYDAAHEVAGLYDVVNDVFYENAGTGTFGCGWDNDIATYKPLKYTQSTGAQYIDTGIKPTANTEFDIGFSTTNSLTSGSGFGTIFGSRTNYYTDGYQLTTYTAYTSAGHFLFGSNGNADQVRYEANMSTGDNYQTMSLHDRVLTTATGTTVTLPSTTTFNGTYSILLFALRDGNTISEHSSTKIYSCKFWEGDTLLRSFYPAKRTSDNTVGMFDTVTRQFYISQGTSAFIGGEEL